MTRIVYLNGEYLPETEAKISIFDRGFLFADGIYEVSSVLDGKLVDNDAHLARLERSLREIRMPMPAPPSAILTIQRELIRLNRVREGLVYLQATRGAADRDFTFPAGATQTLALFTQEKAITDSPSARTGIRLASTPDIRWARRDVKSVALLAQVLAKQAAADASCQEALMHENGVVTECGSSTPFIVTAEGTIVTRPNSTRILPGVTRAAVERLIGEQGLTFEERAFTLDEAYAAAECFITSASAFVTPAVEIDGRRIGGGQPGPVARRLRELYLDEARRTAS